MEPGEPSEYPYRTKARAIGGSVYLKIPPELLAHNGLEDLKNEDGPDEQRLLIQSEEGEHGHYSSFWNPKKQEENGE